MAMMTFYLIFSRFSAMNKSLLSKKYTYCLLLLSAIFVFLWIFPLYVVVRDAARLMINSVFPLCDVGPHRGWSPTLSESHIKVALATDGPCASITLPEWLKRLDHFTERRVFSQFKEDGVTEYIIHNVLITNHFYVEIGTESGVECNTRLLREHYNWTGLLMDGYHQDPKINLVREMIHPNNIVSILAKNGVFPDTDIGLFSEDTDHSDFYVWQEILKAGFRPRVLISEVNSNFEPNEAFTVVPPPSDKVRFFDGTKYFGASALGLSRLWNRYGYVIVHCTKEQVNCFGVRADLILGLEPDSRSIKQLQKCLWLRRPLAYRVTIHSCPSKLESFVIIDENGDTIDNKTFFNESLQDTKKESTIPIFLQECNEICSKNY